MLEDYNFILAYISKRRIYAAAELPERYLPAASMRAPWAYRTASAWWIMERLEHVE
jgi:hypothetical protein